MKFKSVIAGVAAVAAMSCMSVFSFAECADTELLLAAVPSDNKTVARSAEADTAEARTTSTSGAEGVAAVFGTIILAGAAVVISRKKA